MAGVVFAQLQFQMVIRYFLLMKFLTLVRYLPSAIGNFHIHLQMHLNYHLPNYLLYRHLEKYYLILQQQFVDFGLYHSLLLGSHLQIAVLKISFL